MFPHDAPCHGHTHIMFPTVTGGHPGDRPDPHQAALDLCARCPYRTECRDQWENEPADIQDHGVWFGTTPDMRRRTKGLRRNQTTGLGRGRIHVRCHNCGTTFTGGVRSRYCPTCRSDTRPPNNNPAKAANAEAQRRRRQRLREQGICTTCGRHVARARKTTCIYCAQARAARIAQGHGGAA